MSVRIVSWNLQGRAGLDVDAVARHLSASGAEVVALQEVQRGQAVALAARLGWWSTWRWKHWAVVVPPEGLALLAPEPLGDVRSLRVSGPRPPWSSSRRIALAGTVQTAAGALRIVDVHLGAGIPDRERAEQAGRALRLVAGASCIAGDMNTRPGSTAWATFAAAGLRDAWAEARPGELGATAWGPGSRGGPPTARLDHVLVSDELVVVAADVPEAPGLSDHLPLVVEVAGR